MVTGGWSRWTQTCSKVTVVSFGDLQTSKKAPPEMLDIIVLVWLASFRFHLHFCIFVYWTRKKKSKQNWVFFFLLLSFCFLTCRTQLSLWQPRRPWPRYLNMCFEDFRRKWGFSHLLLTKLGLVSARVGRRGQGEWAVARLPLGASQVGSSLQKQHFYTLGFFCNLINMCPGVFRLEFILFGTLWVSWTWVAISFPIIKHIQIL